jgi:hypothetical protein
MDSLDVVKNFPLLADLAAQGFTQYVASPLSSGGTFTMQSRLRQNRQAAFPKGNLPILIACISC